MMALYYTANAVGLASATISPMPMLTNHVVERQLVRSTCGGHVAWGTPPSQASGDLDALGRGFAAMRALVDGWDGPASAAPSPALIARAAAMLSFALKDLSFVEAPAIVPVADGGLQAEWYSPTYRFEFYFEPDGDVAAWSENRETRVEMENEGSDALAMLLRWTSNLNDDRRATAAV